MKQYEPIYTSLEDLEFNTYSKESDVYLFSFVYEMLSSEKLFNESETTSQTVTIGENPVMNESIPESFRKLNEEC